MLSDEEMRAESEVFEDGTKVGMESYKTLSKMKKEVYLTKFPSAWFAGYASEFVLSSSSAQEIAKRATMLADFQAYGIDAMIKNTLEIEVGLHPYLVGKLLAAVASSQSVGPTPETNALPLSEGEESVLLSLTSGMDALTSILVKRVVIQIRSLKAELQACKNRLKKNQ